MPDRFESGTMNTVGLTGLLEGTNFVIGKTPKKISEKENRQIKYFKTELKKINGIKIYGGDESTVGICGFNADSIDSVRLCDILNDEYGIAMRGGFHCSMLAHKSMGTAKTGMARASVSWFTTENDIEQALKAIYKIVK